MSAKYSGCSPAELIQPPEDRADPIERRDLIECVVGRVAVQQAEALFRQREEDVVFRGEVPVDRGGAIFDALGDFADGDVLITLEDEQVARGVQDGPADRFAVAFVTFLDSHRPYISLVLNRVNSVR